MNSSMVLSKTRVSNGRGTQMSSPRAAIKLRMPHPRDWQREQMPRGCPGGGWALLELTDALANWSTMSKVTCWSAWFPLLSWFPETSHVCLAGCLASSVCFTRDLARFKKINFARLRQRLLSLSLKKVIHLFDWLVGLLSPMFSLCWLVIWRPGSKRLKFSRPCWLKKEHILAIDQLFYCFLSWIFKLSILIVSEVLSIPHRPPSRAAIRTDEIIYVRQKSARC